MKELIAAAREASAAMQADVALSKLNLRGVGRLPLDRDAAAWEITEEQRALNSTRPRNRRWRALDAHDAAVDTLTQRQASAQARLREAEQELQEAPDQDARTLAAWLSSGERGERPSATLYETQRTRDAAKLLVDAVGVELDRALERRVAHVEKHRPKMLADARKDVDDARERMLAQARQLPASRQALLEARETLTWIAAFPAAVESFGSPASLALGLLKPVERTLGTKARIEYVAVIAALEEDAVALADAFGAEAKRQLGIADARTPLTQAMWDNDEDHIAWKKEQRERLRAQRFFADPLALDDEARDLRT